MIDDVRAVVAAFSLSTAIAAALLWFGPPGSDTAAHVYQAWLFRHHGFVLWDNYWYSGRYTFATYSWLYYPLAVVVGIKLLAALSAGVAVAAFAAVAAYRPAAIAFAIVWGAFVLSGAYPFMLGVAFALLALACTRYEPGTYLVRGFAFFALAALTWAASPLALLLLLVVVAGLRRWRAVLVLLPLVALQAVLLLVFRNPGHFPFSWQEAAAAALFCVGAIVLTRGRPVRGVFVAWLTLVALSFLFPSTLGENAARLRFIALPLALLVLRGRPLALAAPLALVAAAYNVSPLAWSFVKGHDERAEHASYWAPAIAFLHAHNTPDFRVNALDTVGHWEAVYLPEAGIPITRGWFRQDDFPQNRVLYHALDLRTYVRWLRAQGVRYVLVPRDRLDYSSKREPPLAAKLHFVTWAGKVAIYELRDPTPIVPGAHVTRLTHDSITVRLAHPGSYRVAIRQGEGWRKLPAASAGSFTLTFP
jgi:hypothetical protein